MAKKIFYADDARQRVQSGAKMLYDAVKTTYGPKGRNVVIGKSFGAPTVTHDGVTVAQAIDLPDDNEETLGYKVGAELIKTAASKLNKVAGDGTTTVTVLTYNIIEEANKLIAAGYNPMELRRGIESAGAEVVAKINKLAESIEGKNARISEVATISAGSEEIGKLIASVMEKIGKDGVITVESGQSLDMESEVVEGFSLDKGWSSPFFVSDQVRQEAVFDKPAILITDKKISNIQEFLPFLEKLATSGKKDIVIFADEVEGEALSVLILNKLKGILNVAVVKAPAFGERRKQTLSDIAILTGGVLISEDLGMTFEDAELNMLGSARKVIIGKDETTIVEGAGKKNMIKARVEEIKALAENAPSEYEQEQLSKRAASLAGKVAVIKVGGATETEIDEKKYRVDDAVAAVKAALSGGIVAGGGVTLVNIAERLKPVKDPIESVGRDILKRSLKAPFVQIVENAGLNSQALLAQVESAKDGQGVNVMSPDKGLIDLKKAGVIDPAQVTKEAVQNAVSIAATAITMGALVVDLPEKEIDASTSSMGQMGF
ncbi:chaperonin GroEL [Candidatus Saccharibacteria bacterium]|jgi:chaperonin GroEL|nr:chaperonin GroEL [Candidatus Saccharibacteria bacterium]MBP9489638.1 chaperonin GroEL [Candidatus Saccharibacteria bacterium]MBP9552440.1 chaperonin GroEL [Candidatus Saccharibacteria bacterium]